MARIKTYKEYIIKIQERFPEFSINDIDNIIKTGSRHLYKASRVGADSSLNSTIDDGAPFKIVFGTLKFYNMLNRASYILRRLLAKNRILFKWLKLDWDGYYYFGLTEKAFREYVKQMHPKFNTWDSRRIKYKNTTFKYGDVIMYKLLEDCKLNYRFKHFFRIKYPTGMKFRWKALDFKSNRAEYILRRTIDGYESPYTFDYN